MMYVGIQFNVVSAVKEVRIKDLEGFDDPCLLFPFSIGNLDDVVEHFGVVIALNGLKDGTLAKWIDKYFGISSEFDISGPVYFQRDEPISYTESKILLTGYRAMLDETKKSA